MKQSFFLFKVLKERNYRRFVIAQTIALSGSLVQIVALNWLVYKMTRSPLLLGIVSFARQSPIFFVGFFTGPLLDRWNRRFVVLVTYGLTALCALILFILLATETIAYWNIIIICIFLGVINAVDLPARQSFVADVTLERKNLHQNISADSLISNLTQIVGPSLGGFLISIHNESLCFAVASFFYVIGFFLLLTVKSSVIPNKKEGVPFFLDIQKGIHYIMNTKQIAKLFSLIALYSFFGIPFLVLSFPIYAKDILKGGPQMLGFLHTFWAIGSITAAFYLGSHGESQSFGKKILLASLLFGITLVGLSQSKQAFPVLGFVLLAGFSRLIQMTGSNALIQTVVDEDKRGRVMTFFSMTFLGLAPFGTLLAGSLSQAIGVTNMILVGGILCTLGAFFFLKTHRSYNCH